MLKYQVQVHTPDEIIAGIVTDADEVQIEEARSILQNLNCHYPLELKTEAGYIYVSPGILQKSTIHLVIEKE